MEENENAKQLFIRSFHDNAVKRLEFLSRLSADGHQKEAMTLCLTYIDSFSQWLQWPSDKSGQNFIEAVVAFGEDPLLGLIHPRQAVSEFNRMNQSWKKIATRIESVFAGPTYELQTKDDFLRNLKQIFSNDELRLVRKEIWRTTMAAIPYYWLRNPAVHNFDPGPDISFSNTTYQGSLIPNLDFKRLHSIAINLHSALRHRSDTTGQWFGNDNIIDSR